MNQFPEECHVKGCPCHDFAKMPSNRFQGYQRPSEGVNEALPSRQVAKTPLPATGSTFEHDWNHAPSGRRRRVEMEDALWWYVAGGRAKEVELLELFNGGLGRDIASNATPTSGDNCG